MSRNALALLALVFVAGTTLPALAQEGPKEPPKPDFPPFAEVSKDYTKVNSSSDKSEEPLLGIYTRDKDQQLLIELPREFASKKYMIAVTTASGEPFAGLQGPSFYVYWKRYNNRIALVAPQIEVRSTGDDASKVGVERAFTDRILVDMPIVAMGPGGGPVIDGDAFLAGNVGRFVPPGFMTSGASGANPALAAIKKAKAFPQNVEIALEMPTAGGVLKTFHYSISIVPDSTGYTPRAADERVGYFQTWYRDLGKFKEDEKWVRCINRWNLEKADPKLKMSPPKKPIVFYVEHTVPVRYRRYVRDGALMWNKAFEKIGITEAVEVYYQDKATNTNMDKDPEDVRYNFIRWVTNDISTAIGPHRSHPLTGQILDADVVLTDGWIRTFWSQSNEIIPDIIARHLSTEELAWFDTHPRWDPRLRVLSVSERDAALTERAVQQAQRGIARFAPAGVQPFAQTSPGNAGAWNCFAAQGKSVDMAISRMALELQGMLDDTDDPPTASDGEKKDEKKEDKKETKNGDKKDEKKEVDLLDGIPEWFVGPALADLTAHEVGHTLGLRHNFKASCAYPLAEINSAAFKGKKPYTSSVMDYNPVNINLNKSLIQGDYVQLDIGPYDLWAIEYGYTSGDPKKIAGRAPEPELQFGSDEDAGGIDPTVRRYDLGADPRDYAQSRLDLAKFARARILDKFVKDGQSWSKARRGYAITLAMQADAISIMSGWVGSARVYRDRKGDPSGRPPIEVVPANQQRAALAFVIDAAFKDEAFGLSPELLKHLTIDRFEDPGAGRGEPAWPIHDQVAGVQATALSNL
ncbi:MAG: zinc-dependent metalloprotease, partial [Phycisphaerales bacterium]